MMQSIRYEIHIGEIFDMDKKQKVAKHKMLITQDQYYIITQFADVKKDVDLNDIYKINDCEFRIVPYFEIGDSPEPFEEKDTRKMTTEELFEYMNSVLRDYNMKCNFPLSSNALEQIIKKNESVLNEIGNPNNVGRELYDKYLEEYRQSGELPFNSHENLFDKFLKQQQRVDRGSGESTEQIIENVDLNKPDSIKEQPLPDEEYMTVGKLRQMMSSYNDNASISVQDKDNNIQRISTVSLLHQKGLGSFDLKSFVSIKTK